MVQTGVSKEFIVKKWLYAAGLGLVMASSASVMAADKIAVVNVGQIFQQMPAREAVASKEG